MSKNRVETPGVSMLWAESVWFSDVDDCLIDTEKASVAGSLGIFRTFAKKYGPQKAVTVQQSFNQLFCLILAANQGSTFEELDKLEGGFNVLQDFSTYSRDAQNQIAEDHGHFKTWSREVMIKFAAEEMAGINISPEIIREAADSYWDILQRATEVFPDAIDLSNEIASHGRPLILATASDARLTLLEDRKQFRYDVDRSRKFKNRRMDALRRKGLTFKDVLVGDVADEVSGDIIDKPNPEFFKKMQALGEAAVGVASFNIGAAVMLGDSYINDLQIPEGLGFGAVFLRQRGLEGVHVVDEHVIAVGALSAAAQFFK